MKKTALLIIVIITLAFMHCAEKQSVSIEPLCQILSPDGFLDNWTTIRPIDPPPPAPFRFLSGDPVRLDWVTFPANSREGIVIVQLDISMGTVGEMSFTGGGARGIIAATAKIEKALNTWQFTNNGWGPIKAKLNFGDNSVELDFSEFMLQRGIVLNKSSLLPAFRGRRGAINIIE